MDCDRNQFFGALSYAIVLAVVCAWAFGFPFALIGAIFFLVRVSRLRKFAARDPYYFPIYDKTKNEQKEYAPGRAAGARTPPPDRWKLASELRARNWDWKDYLYAFFFGKPFDSGYRQWRLSRYDRPLFGFVHPFLLTFLPTEGIPTGREIIAMLQMKYPAIYRTFFLDNPAEALPDRLPWRAKPDPWTVRNRDETFTRSWLIEGFDFAGADLDTRANRSKVPFNAMITNLPPGYTLHARAIQTPSTRPILDKIYPTEEARLVADEFLARMEQTPTFEGWTQIDLTFIPQIANLDKTEGSPEGDPDEEDLKPKSKDDIRDISIAAYQEFVGTAEQFEISLKPLCRTMRRLGYYEDEDYRGRPAVFDSQTESFELMLTGSRKKMPRIAPWHGLYNYLGAKRLFNRNKYLRIEDTLVGVIEVYQYPSTTTPDMFLAFDGLDKGTMMICTRFISRRNTEIEKELDRVYKEEAQRAEGTPSIAGLGGSSAVQSTPDALAAEHAADTVDAKKMHRERRQIFGHTSTAILLYEKIDTHETEEQTAERLLSRQREIIGRLEGMIFEVAKNNGNHLEVFLSLLPGNWRDNVVQPLVASGNVVNLVTTAHPWTGEDRIIEKDGYYIMHDGQPAPCLAYFLCEGGRIFAFNPQRGNRGGHTFVVGATGAGKSGTIDRLTLEHSGYTPMLKRGARQVIIDVDGSHRATGMFLHGNVISLGATRAKGFAPFADIETQEGRKFARTFLRKAIRTLGEDPTTEAWRESIAQIIQNLTEVAPEERDMVEAVNSMIPEPHKQLLRDLTPAGGKVGNLYNGVEPLDNDATYLVFDIAEAHADEEMRSLTMLCLTHEIERMALRGIPMMLVAEELWSLIADPETAEYFQGWLRRLRKFGTWIFMITHEVADLSALGEHQRKAFLNNFATFIVFPHEKANAPENAESMKSLGLEKWECDYLARIAPDPENGETSTFAAYIIKGKRKRLVSTYMDEVAQATCGNSSVPRREEIANYVRRFGDQAYAAWILYKGGPNARAWYNHFTQKLVPLYRELRAANGVQEEPYDADALVA